MSAKAKIFIDGEVGTTGLEIRKRLAARDDLELIQLSDDMRKDEDARRDAIGAADIAILCLPDDAAVEATAWANELNTRVIDASTAHRVADGWTYGFPELDKNQSAKIAAADRVTNPGCYAVASVALLHPLTASGLLPADYPVSIFGISGYSGGGKGLIARFEDQSRDDVIPDTVQLYALGFDHKHLPEITKYGGLTQTPTFAPHRANYYRGMMVEVGLNLTDLECDANTIRTRLHDHYEGAEFVKVSGSSVPEAVGPEDLNETNGVTLSVFGSGPHALLVAQLDNLGKGASGQAVQCLNLMLGFDEGVGLTP